MGSFLSSLTSTPPPPDDFDFMEMEPLSRLSGPRTRQLDLDQYSGRRYPLNPNGHFTTNLLTGFRRRLRTDTGMQSHVQTQQEWVLEPLLISADHGPNDFECKAGAKTSDGSGDKVYLY